MAISITLPTSFGETRELYVRLNNVDLANHDVPAVALFRGYASKDAFEAGAAFMFEKEVTFPANAPANPWALAYAALKELPEFEGAVNA